MSNCLFHPDTPCAVVLSTYGLLGGPWYVNVMKMKDVEANSNIVVISFPEQGNTTLDMCLASADECAEEHNQKLNLRQKR